MRKKKKKILLIEDSADQRLLERIVLTDAGYEVLESDNSSDGFELAVKERPDLVLMDIRLPYKKRGINAAQAMRNNRRTRGIPIIFYTSYPLWEESAIIKNIPKSIYLTKSADSAILLKSIEQFLK